jgi:4,5:9,10-diseco-3-hydroxy-5,9,17-trioxoandrosta-1(10),2-diene-4-oate hydrolase
MTGQVIAANRKATRVERYRQTERALWEHYGMRPAERFVELTSPAARLRVLEVGVGEPVLLVHGLIGPGGWAPLVRELRGFRCVILDRPGWGLSSSIDYSRYSYGSVTADLLAGVLDGLGIDRAHVIGGSIGTLRALRLAASYPSRAGRLVLMGTGPLLAEMRLPTMMRAIASPLGALMIRRTDAGMLRSILRQSGHATSLADGRIPEEFITWRVAASRETDAMRSERAMLRGGIVDWARPGWRRGVVFDESALGRLTQPTLYVYGTNDGTAPVEFARKVAGALPHGELHVVEGGGHEPWFEDVDGVGSRVTRFLTEA